MTAEQFKERFVSLYPKLFAIVIANIGNCDEAKDIMQSFYLKLWEKRNELDVVANDIGYCRSVLLNMCRDRWRAKSIEAEWVVEESDFPYDSHEGFEAVDMKERIENFIDCLPEKPRCIMRMRMQGASAVEIASVTGLSVENVYTILSRTRQLIRNFYNKING